MYRVEIDWAPAYELLVSVKAFAGRREHKTLDLGAAWVRAVREQLTSELAAELSSSNALECIKLLDLLVWRCPDDRSATGFLTWLGARSAGELYEYLAPYLSPIVRLPSDLGALRDRSVRLLSAWEEQYFRQLDPAILIGLEEEAETKRLLAATMPPDELAELAMSGVRLAPETNPPLVLLVPQYHYRPWNLFVSAEGMRFVEYPADVLPSPPGEPPPHMMRLARALSDESRLKILRLLTAGPLSFTEVVAATGLSKSTVNHHMVMLRASGLVRVEDTASKTVSYVLRLDAVDDLADQLHGYLKRD
jgi:DNA-binding transcriptional ArsR family regulator